MTDTHDTRTTDNDRRSLRKVLVASAIGSGLVLAAALVLSIPRGATAQAADTSDITSNAPTAEQLRVAEIEFQENMASGWMPMQDDHPFMGEPVKGWVPMFADASSLLAEYQKVEGRLPVFSQRGGGDLLGYMYQYIGFVPANVADSGTFDAHSIRSKTTGCDPILADGSIDQECSTKFHAGR